jgi:hypothetical protein
MDSSPLVPPNRLVPCTPCPGIGTMEPGGLFPSLKQVSALLFNHHTGYDESVHHLVSGEDWEDTTLRGKISRFPNSEV